MFLKIICVYQLILLSIGFVPISPNPTNMKEKLYVAGNVYLIEQSEGN